MKRANMRPRQPHRTVLRPDLHVTEITAGILYGSESVSYWYGTEYVTCGTAGPKTAQFSEPYCREKCPCRNTFPYFSTLLAFSWLTLTLTWPTRKDLCPCSTAGRKKSESSMGIGVFLAHEIAANAFICWALM